MKQEKANKGYEKQQTLKPEVTENEEKKGKKKGLSASRLRDYTNTTINPDKKIFLTYEDKMKGDEMSPKKRAVENLKRSLDPKVATVFKGIVTGYNEMEDEGTGKVDYHFLVNSDCGVSGYKGRIIRIPIQHYIAPLANSEQSMKQFDFETATTNAVINYLNSRIGSECEFVVTEMDEMDYESGYVLASRRKAMERKRRKFWEGKAKVKGAENPVYILHEGSLVESRIVAVTQTGCYVEIFGIEVFIPLTELSYTWLNTAREMFNVNEKLTVVVRNINRSSGRITFEASHKDSFPNPIPTYMSEYMRGDKIKGKVTKTFWDPNIRSVIAFVNIDDKFELRCTMKAGITVTPMPGDTVQVLIANAAIDLEKNTGKMWGKIIHVSQEFEE